MQWKGSSDIFMCLLHCLNSLSQVTIPSAFMRSESAAFLNKEVPPGGN